MYFPTYRDPLEDSADDDPADIMYKMNTARREGNQTPFWALNAYLDKFAGFYELLKSKSMDEEDFQTLVTKHLEKIEE